MIILTIILTLQDPHDTQHKPGEENYRGKCSGEITGGKLLGEITGAKITGGKITGGVHLLCNRIFDSVLNVSRYYIMISFRSAS